MEGAWKLGKLEHLCQSRLQKNPWHLIPDVFVAYYVFLTIKRLYNVIPLSLYKLIYLCIVLSFFPSFHVFIIFYLYILFCSILLCSILLFFVSDVFSILIQKYHNSYSILCLSCSDCILFYSVLLACNLFCTVLSVLSILSILPYLFGIMHLFIHLFSLGLDSFLFIGQSNSLYILVCNL